MRKDSSLLLPPSFHPPLLPRLTHTLQQHSPVHTMAPYTYVCNHDQHQCVHMERFGAFHPETWSRAHLASTCEGYERTLAHNLEMLRRDQPEPLTDHETEVDPEEAEDEMNNLPSPNHTHSRFWTPEYQARREARRRLWSPPLTPPMPGLRDYSLQPSQRPPPTTPRRPTPPLKRHPPFFLPPTDFQLQPPPKTPPSRVRKVRPVHRAYRPITRSMKSSKLLSLHLRKGLVNIISSTGHSQSVTLKQYWRMAHHGSLTPCSLYLLRSLFSKRFWPQHCSALRQRPLTAFSRSSRPNPSDQASCSTPRRPARNHRWR